MCAVETTPATRDDSFARRAARGRGAGAMDARRKAALDAARRL